MWNEKKLWDKRRSDYWAMAVKYLRLIANSGFLFTIYLLFVFGSYYYGQFLEWLPETFPAVLFFTALFSWFITRGRVRTFAKTGDLFFLTPREGKMAPYFRSSIIYSWLMETFYMAFLLLILAPLFFDRIHPSGSLPLSIFLLLSGLKWWNLASGFEEQRIQEQSRYRLHTAIRAGLNIVTVYALFSVRLIWLIGGMVVLLVIFYFAYFYKLSKTHSLKWDRLVDIEDQTVMTFYRIANSFTDVPALKSKVRTRNWLSFLFRFVSYKQGNVYRYLFSRAFARSNDYFGIYMRLTLLGLLFLYVVRLDWGRWLIGFFAFAYMTALQLETLRHHFNMSSMVELYPGQEQGKFESHKFWVQVLGSFQTVIFGVFSTVLYGPVNGLVVLLLLLAVYYYHSSVRLGKVYGKVS